MKIFGINFDTHDSSVALIEDGEILFAAAEERYSRVKMDNAFPALVLRECLRQTGTMPEEIDIVAVSGFEPPKNWYYYAKSALQTKRFTKGKTLFSYERHFGQKKLVLKGVPALLSNVAFCTGLPQFLLLYLVNRLRLEYLMNGFKGRIVYASHHDCHVATACFTSGFDEALSLVTEGYDWECSFVLDDYERGNFRSLAKTYWPHSPGAFYRLVTTILGFDYLRHAGKITGLAAYGNPKTVYEKVSGLIWVDGLTLKSSPLTYTLNQEYLFTGKLPGYFEGYSMEDIAAAFQRRLEEVTVEIVQKALSMTGKKNVVLSGGVAGNVLMNQRIHEIEAVKGIYVHPAMSDSGQALGAALYAYSEELNNQGCYVPSKRLEHVYLGSGYSDADLESAIHEAGLRYSYFKDVEIEIAQLLADKKVVARFNGRMEYGPRTLGNRSILFHASDRTVNDWLNKRLGRTEFMPFAPSVLMEDRNDYFHDVNGAKYTAEFMTITFNCTERMIRECPAVVHIDGTARPNFVREEANWSYYKIIKGYKRLTGIGVILNTSFNMHEEPIVCSPNDAIRAFQRGHLDYLAMGNCLVKNEGVS